MNMTGGRVSLPKELVEQIDALVGRDDRIAFIEQVAREELDRRHLSRSLAAELLNAEPKA
jgi:metal-responsive CopG/Arc/MetJ family transcriptional regulator